MRILLERGKDAVEEPADLAALDGVLDAPDHLLWIDLVNPSAAEMDQMQQRFKFHPLAVEDALHQGQRPKLDEYDNHLFLVIYAVSWAGGTAEMTTDQIAVFLGPHYMVTVTTGTVAPLEVLHKRIDQDSRPLQQGPGFLLYHLVDAVVDGFFPILNDMDDRIDTLEDEIVEGHDDHILPKIFGLKRALVSLRKLAAPQREVLNILCDRSYADIGREAQLYFRDAYDHVVRIYDMLETYRDLLSGAMEIHLTMVSNRMNEVMKRLTTVATIFMPISFLAGLFGMNMPFSGMEAGITGWTHPWAFLGVLTLMAGVVGSMIWWMKKNKWI